MDINSTQFAAFSSFKNTVETYVGDLCQTHGWNWRATRRSRGQPARCGLGKSTVVAVALGIQGTHHHTRSCKIIQVNRCHIVSCHLILQVSYHGDSAKCCSAQSRVFELDWTGKANPLKHVRLRSVSSETNVVTHMSGPHSECLSHRLKIGLIAGRELARQLVKIRASCVDSKVWLLKSTWQHRFFLKCQHCYESQGGHQNRSRPGVLPLVEVWGPKKFNLGVLGRWSKHGGWMISQGGGAGASGAKRRNLRCIFWMFPPHNFFVVFVVVELDSVLKERTWLISHSASWRYACACPCATSPWLLSACTGNCRNGPGSQMFTDVHRWFKQCSAQRSRFFRSWMGVDLKLQSQCHEMSSDQSHWMMSVETYLRSHVVVSTARSRAPGISWSFFYLLQHATRYFMILMKYSDIYIYTCTYIHMCMIFMLAYILIILSLRTNSERSGIFQSLGCGKIHCSSFQLKFSFCWGRTQPCPSDPMLGPGFFGAPGELHTFDGTPERYEGSLIWLVIFCQYFSNVFQFCNLHLSCMKARCQVVLELSWVGHFGR